MSNEKLFKLKLLGTGTSTGVPTIFCTCPTCQSNDPKDKRLRCSVLISYEDSNIIIDTGPDFREQIIANNIHNLDAAIYTHHHFDHIGGFDDIRGMKFILNKKLPIYINQTTLENLQKIFAFEFHKNENNELVSSLVDIKVINSDSFKVCGLNITVLPLLHGELEVFGFRIGNIAYCTDTNNISETTIELMKDLDILILDGLRDIPHKTHFNIEQAIQQADIIGAKTTYLTHIAHQIKHSEWENKLPNNIKLAYDGLTFEGKL